MKRLVIGLFVITSCGAEPPTPVAPIAQVTQMTAELEFKRSLELDYGSPMNKKFKSPRVDFVDSVPLHAELFKSRCVAGDRSACLRAISYSIIVDDAFSSQVMPYIQANCREGHDLSCRYVASRDHEYPDLSDAELQRGCEAGMSHECRQLHDTRRGAEINCLYARESCEKVSWAYRGGTSEDEQRARYFLELGCQSAMFSSCFNLVIAYRSGEWTEPVPGRGIALTRFMCELWPTEMECTWGEARMFMPRR